MSPGSSPPSPPGESDQTPGRGVDPLVEVVEAEPAEPGESQDGSDRASARGWRSTRGRAGVAAGERSWAVIVIGRARPFPRARSTWNRGRCPPGRPVPSGLRRPRVDGHAVHRPADARPRPARRPSRAARTAPGRSSATWSGPGWIAACPRARSARRRTPRSSGSTRPITSRLVERFARSGGGAIEVDTWMSPGSLLAARLAAGAAVEAVDSVVKGPDRRAACLVRPPGHHAGSRTGRWGSASSATSRSPRPHAVRRSSGLEPRPDRRLRRPPRQRHAGDLLRRPPASPSSRSTAIPFYPGTGAADETGTGAGLGTKLEHPLPYGTPRTRLSSPRSSDGLTKLADAIRPELVLISAGFDAHAEDPVGDLGLEVEDFVTLTKLVVEVAETHAERPARERPRRGL